MQIIHKNNGDKINYTLDGSFLRIGSIGIDLEEYQRDDDIYVDICENQYGDLVIGASIGRRYVAELFIPGRHFNEIEAEPGTMDMNYPENEGDMGIAPMRAMVRVADPFNPDDVVLTLWSLDVENEGGIN